MLRTMLFIDYENFEIARRALYYNQEGVKRTPFINWNTLPQNIIDALGGDLRLIKTYLFVPEQDDFLQQDETRRKRYDYLLNLDNLDHVSVVRGRHETRPARSDVPMSIDDKDSYRIAEKGTDVNIATQLLVKAFNNGFDVAVVLSGDKDYIPVYDILDTLGKLVIVVAVEGQSLHWLKTHSDRRMHMSLSLLKTCEQVS